MINLFEFASDDQSLQYLVRIFSNMGGIIPAVANGSVPQATLPSGVTLSLLGTMFKTFNSVVLAVGALIIVYVTFVGVMQTAHEGEFMKKWHGLWTPLRIVLGISALFPTASGYSGIQLIMMWVVVQGIGAADGLWSTALGYIDLVGSPYAQVTLPSTDASNTMGNLFQGLTCDATFREAGKNPGASITENPGSYYCNKTGTFCAANPFSTDPNISSYQMGPGGACGTLYYCNQTEACKDESSLKCVACKAQVQSLDGIINKALIPLAGYFEQTDYSYRNFIYNNDPSVSNSGGDIGFDQTWITKYCAQNGIGTAKNQCCSPGTPGCDATKDLFAPFPVTDDNGKNFGASTTTIKNLYWAYSIAPKVTTALDPKFTTTNFINIVTSEYLSDVGTAVNDVISSYGKDKTLQDPMLEKAKEAGWIMAGGFYYFLGKINAANLQDSFPTLQFKASNPEINTPSEYVGDRMNFTAAGALTAMMQGAVPTSNGNSDNAPPPQTSGGSSTSSTDGVTDLAKSAVVDTAAQFKPTDQPNLSFNPLVQLQMAGSAILWIVLLLFPLIVALSLAIGTASSLNFFFAGNGGFLPIGTGMLMVYFLLAPALLALMGLMLAIGGLLSIYLPLVPYIIFTMGGIGWMLSVVEAMVAGPLVALGVMAPGGHHEVLGKAEPALMFLFNVFLRPSLMIFGLVASLLLASVVVMMINTAVWGSIQNGVWVVGPVIQGVMGHVDFSAGAGNGTLVIGSPISFLIFLAAYVMLIVSALNKCFEAIHIIPEKVMRWIGGQGEQYGESTTLGEVKRGTEATESGVARAGEHTSKAADETHKAREQQKKGPPEDKNPGTK